MAAPARTHEHHTSLKFRALDRLGQLETGLAEALRRLDALEGRKRPTDAEADERLLGAIAGYVGGSVFAAADLLAAHDPELRAVLDGMDGRALGAWLRRLRRQTTAPYRMVRVGRDDVGALWRLAVCADSHTVAAEPGDRPAQ